MIEPEIRRLRQLREELQAIADADAAEAPARFAFETGTEGDRHRRYALSNERVLNRRFSLFLTARKMSEAGSLDHIDLNIVGLSSRSHRSCPIKRWRQASRGRRLRRMRQ